jgi:hypothetical protein
MSQAFRYFIKGIELRGETSDPSDNVEGSVFHNSSSNRLKAYIQASIREIVTNDQSQTLTNKTIDADNNTISNIEVDNLKSGVLNTSTTLASASDTQLPSALAVKTYIDDKTAAQNEASEITFVPAGTIAATNVQTMGEELDGDIQGHINDTAAAHNASAINNIPSGNLAATDVQAALNELQSDVDTRATSSALNSHTGASSGVHGVTGSVVGTSDSQILTNKTIDASSNTISNIVDANIKANAAIDASKIGDGSVSTTEFQYLNSVTSNVQTQINSKQATITGAATTIVSSDLSASKVVVSDASGKVAASAVSTTTLGYLDATSSIQTQLNAKQATITGAATSITSADLTASKVVVSDSSGKVAASSVSTTTLGFLDATSSVQTQLNAKVNSSGGTLTSGSIVTPIRSDVKQDTKANLTTYAATAANGQLVYATDTKEYLAVKDGTLVAIGSASGVGGTDILFAQTFESAALTDFTQTGLSLDTSAPLHGAVSAKLTHQAAVNQSFKQVVAVDRKFRGQAIVLSLNIKSAASAGNVTISVYDETNAASLLSSTQLNLSNDVDGISNTVSFTIPSTSSSISYTITALPQAGSPVTYVDDVVAELSNVALLETSVTVPNITAWQSYVPTFQGFGSPTNVEFEYRQVGENVEIRGKFTSGTSTAVEARMGLPTGLTSAGTGIIPSIQIAGLGGRNESFAGISVLIEPSVTYLTFGQYADSTRFALTKQNANAIANSSTQISFTASVPCAGLSATSDKTIPLTQSGLVQEGDSYLRLTGFTPVVGSTANKILTLISSTYQQNIGNAIQYLDDAVNGARFIAQRDGLYRFEFSADTHGSAGHAVGLTKNTSSVTTGFITLPASEKIAVGYDTGSGNIVHVFGEAYLTAGDIIRLHTDGATSLSNASWSTFTASYQGSLQQVSVSSDQKITIPTSELRFEGASARGTGTETAIVQFTSMTKIRGDAFTVDNSNGTAITMTKAGRLSVSSGFFVTGTGYTAQITRNQQTRTAVSTNASEVLASDGAGTVGGNNSMSWTGDVSVGDIIRVASSAAVSANAGNSLSLSFQEQDISVSVTNTLPQFSDSDSYVRVATGNGFGSSATTIRRFASVTSNVGSDILYADSATAGASFTVQSAGVYNIAYTDVSASGTPPVQISINGSAITISNIPVTSGGMTISAQPYLQSGDIITVGSINPAGITSASSSAQVLVSKVGKPNVTGVDVTPFVNLPQPESQSSYFNSSATVAAGTITGALQSNTNNGIFSYNATTGVYTMLKNADVSISASVSAAGASTVQVLVSLNGSFANFSNTEAVANRASTISYNQSLKVGDALSIVTSGGSINLSRISVLATALSDQILTAPETFSTDTAALAYSSTYTLATLNTAPVGTYITFTYAANTNTRTQTATRPTQTDADMNTNGIQIFTRAYNAASTAAQPAAFAIQIGKGLKGKSLDLYKSAGKVTAGSLDYSFATGNTVELGLKFKEYNESTGVLLLDLGSRDAANTSAILNFSDQTTQTSGYLVINASKNPALTGLGFGSVVRAKYTSNSGQAVGTSATLLTMEDYVYDSNNAYVAGVYTVPENGTYIIAATWLSAAVAISASTGSMIIYVYVDGVSAFSNFIRGTGNTLSHSTTITDQFVLKKGQTVSIYGSCTTATTMAIGSLSITKFSVVKDS